MVNIAIAVHHDDGRDFLDEFEAGQLANDFDFATPQEVLAWAIDRWGGRLAICTSFQAEGMAIFDMAWRIDNGTRLFTVDTGRLPQETYDAIELVRARYGVEVEVYSPNAAEGRGDGQPLRAEPVPGARSRPACSAAACGRSSPSAACSTGSTPG